MNFQHNSYNLISAKQLEDLCDKSSDSIFLALEKISLVTTLYYKCKIKVMPPFATNFRDALFHYKKLYESDTVEDAISQAEAIDEHLSRAIKDSLMQLVQVLLYSSTFLYEENDTEDSDKAELQELIHSFKQSILKLRIDAMDIVRITQGGIIDEIAECIADFSQKPKIKDKLLDRCSRYIKRIDVKFE